MMVACDGICSIVCECGKIVVAVLRAGDCGTRISQGIWQSAHQNIIFDPQVTFCVAVFVSKLYAHLYQTLLLDAPSSFSEHAMSLHLPIAKNVLVERISCLSAVVVAAAPDVYVTVIVSGIYVSSKSRHRFLHVCHEPNTNTARMRTDNGV